LIPKIFPRAALGTGKSRALRGLMMVLDDENARISHNWSKFVAVLT
jgi:hypothetical protein